MKQWSSETIKSEGLTLIEMLVAVAVFSITIGAISGILFPEFVPKEGFWLPKNY